MTEQDAIQALDKVMASTATLVGLPVAWPNEKFTGTRPFLKVDVLPATTWTASLQNEGRIWRGIYQVTIMTEPGSGYTKHQKTAQRIVDAFEVVALPDGERRVSGLKAGSGEVYLADVGAIAAGYNTADGYNIPISLNYRADT